MPNILYLVHNLSDPAVDRRVSMFLTGGATVQVAGFRRGDAPPPRLPVHTVLELDITHDGRMMQRMAATLGAARRAPGWVRTLAAPDIIVARNLEMLGVANRLLYLWPRRPRLVYECLDLHRLLLRQDQVGKAMRGLEQRLMRNADLVVTSSPAFLRNHFSIYGSPPVVLVENKVFAPALEKLARNPVATEVPEALRVGWFGALRCSKSLAALDAVSRQLGGQIGVELRGRPALTAFTDFHATTKAAPHLHYGGPYRYPDDLATLYSSVHFVWAIDFFEEGLNSSWLLPNRLYEGCLNGAIPIALARTETAAFIERLGIGIVVPDISVETLATVFGSMTATRVRDLAAAVARQDKQLFRCDKQECAELVERLAGHHPAVAEPGAAA